MMAIIIVGAALVSAALILAAHRWAVSVRAFWVVAGCIVAIWWVIVPAIVRTV
jgi:hypothetical protein